MQDNIKGPTYPLAFPERLEDHSSSCLLRFPTSVSFFHLPASLITHICYQNNKYLNENTLVTPQWGEKHIQIYSYICRYKFFLWAHASNPTTRKQLFQAEQAGPPLHTDYLLLYLPLLRHFWKECGVWRSQGPSAGPHLCFWQAWYESFPHSQWRLLAKGDEIPPLSYSKDICYQWRTVCHILPISPL